MFYEIVIVFANIHNSIYDYAVQFRDRYIFYQIIILAEIRRNNQMFYTIRLLHYRGSLEMSPKFSEKRKGYMKPITECFSKNPLILVFMYDRQEFR